MLLGSSLRRLFGARPRIALLLGAGFSQAYGFSGTRDLTDAIDEHFAHRLANFPQDPHAPIYRRLVDNLRAILPDGAYNFEVLLEVLQWSEQFREPDYPRPPVISPLRPLISFQDWLGDQPTVVLHHILENAIMVIRNRLIEEIKDLDIVRTDAAGALLRQLSRRYGIDCIDLNYDDLVDRAAPFFEDGFVSDPGAGFASFSIEHLERARHRLVHVHGHVRFGFVEHQNGMKLLENLDGNASRWVYTDDGGIHSTIVSGLAKSEKLIRPPYSEFNRWAYNVLAETRRTVMVGYSVGDIHLNVWLMHAALRFADRLRFCFVTQSVNLDKENDSLKAVLCMAAGYRSLRDVDSLEKLLNFDDGGFARHGGLAVFREGLPLRGHDYKKMIKFLDS